MTVLMDYFGFNKQTPTTTVRKGNTPDTDEETLIWILGKVKDLLTKPRDVIVTEGDVTLLTLGERIVIAVDSGRFVAHWETDTRHLTTEEFKALTPENIPACKFPELHQKENLQPPETKGN
jgi:hypothetical protein